MMELSIPTVTSALLSFDLLSIDLLILPTSLKKIQDLNTDCKNHRRDVANQKLHGDCT